MNKLKNKIKIPDQSNKNKLPSHHPKTKANPKSKRKREEVSLKKVIMKPKVQINLSKETKRTKSLRK